MGLPIGQTFVELNALLKTPTLELDVGHREDWGAVYGYGWLQKDAAGFGLGVRW